MLEHLFGSTTRLNLLQLFFNAPERAFYLRELSRLCDTQLNGIRREIANLEKMSIIKQVEAGSVRVEEIGTERSKYYQLNSDAYLTDELRALILKAKLVEEQAFIDEILKRAGDARLFMLTGLFTNSPETGTDMLLVGDIKPVPLAKLIRSFEKFLNQPIRYTVMTNREFKERKEIGDKFLYGILESKYKVALDKFGLH